MYRQTHADKESDRQTPQTDRKAGNNTNRMTEIGRQEGSNE